MMATKAPNLPPGWPSLFWLTFNRSANAMALLRPDRVFVAINSAYEEALGYESEDLIGRRVDRIVAPSHWRRLETEWSELQRTGRVCGQRDLLRGDGRRLRIRYAAHRENLTRSALVLSVVTDELLVPTQADLEHPTSADRLTSRELEIVHQIAAGHRAHEIAGHLSIGTVTVRTHVRNAMAKLGVRSQAQLVATVLGNGPPSGVSSRHGSYYRTAGHGS
jgi:PAS domain S-box-containing protein